MNSALPMLSGVQAKDVIAFWFSELEPKHWWQKDEALDAMITDRFGDLHRKAVCAELAEWRSTAEGALAEVLVLDQFSRNIHRDTARAFAADPLALALAQVAVASQLDQNLEPGHRVFLYMPYMHSESALIHAEAFRLFSSPPANNLDFELGHKKIIDRFGRYPHRNAILGRQSTVEELAFLNEPGSSY